MTGWTLILAAAGLMAALCAVLAALIVLAERYLVNYGPCKVNVNNGAKEFTVKGGKTLLVTLMEQGIFIPSACGGRGTCAYCKVKVTAGGGPVVPTEEPFLNADERKGNVRLSCQVKVRNDVALTIPEELFLVREYTGTVDRISDLTHDMKLVRIKLDEPGVIEFKTGRYIQIETPAYGNNPEPVYRAYSLASPPEETGAIELIIRLVPGGICTTWVFTMLKEGDTVKFNGPYGQFGLTETDRPMVWIAGGSGMAPFWGMVRHMKQAGIRRPVTYFFGAVSKRDLCLVDEFRALEKEMPGLKFIPALSQPKPEDQWTGETGLITDVVARHIADAANTEFYLCGSGGMIDAAVTVIRSKGVGEDRIFYDKFT